MGTFLLTGGTRGIGHAVAIAMAVRGHRVLLLARSVERAQAVVDTLATPGAVIPCDLAVPTDVDAVAVDEALHGIVSVAGVLHLGRVPAAGGVDQTWAANFLGPARLTERLMPQFEARATVTFVSGQAHRRFPLTPSRIGRSGGLRAAAEVTTAKILWTRGMARAHPEHTFTTFCPGRIRTELHRALPWFVRPVAGALLATGAAPASAAGPIVDLALGRHPTGTYCVEGMPCPPAAHTDDRKLQDAVRAFASRWAS